MIRLIFGPNPQDEDKRKEVMREVMAMFKESVPRVVVANLPPDMSVDELCALFAPVGKVLTIKVSGVDKVLTSPPSWSVVLTGC
jgi:hypothetical protein